MDDGDAGGGSVSQIDVVAGGTTGVGTVDAEGKGCVDVEGASCRIGLEGKSTSTPSTGSPDRYRCTSSNAAYNTPKALSLVAAIAYPPSNIG